MNWFVLCYFSLINFFASVFQGITTFGDAIVLHITWHAMASATADLLHRSPLGDNDVEIVTIATYSRSCVMIPLLVFLAYRSQSAPGAQPLRLPWKLLVVAATPSLVSTVVGERLLVVLPHAVLKMYFGIGCLCFGFLYVAVRAYKLTIRRPTESDSMRSDDGDASPTNPRARRASAVDEHGTVRTQVQVGMGFASLASGIASAMTGVGGPPWMIFTLAMDVPAHMLRLMFPLSAIPSAYTRYGLAIHDGLLSWDVAPYHVCGVAAGVLGLLLGNHVGRRVGPQAFNTIVLTLLFLASALMLISNVVVTTVLLAGGTVGIAVVQVSEQRALRREEAETEAKVRGRSVATEPQHVAADEKAERANDADGTCLSRSCCSGGSRRIVMQVEDLARLYDAEADEICGWNV